MLRLGLRLHLQLDLPLLDLLLLNLLQLDLLLLNLQQVDLLLLDLLLLDIVAQFAAVGYCCRCLLLLLDVLLLLDLLTTKPW